MPEIIENIDFPVSDDWLDFYHRQGLTPRMSPRYFNRLDDNYLNARLGALTENVNMLGKEVDRLRADIARAKPVPKEKTVQAPAPKRVGVVV